MPPHLDDRDDPPPHPPSRNASKLLFFPSKHPGAPWCRRQSDDAPCMRGKSATSAPCMNGKDVNTPFLRRRAPTLLEEEKEKGTIFKLNQL